MKRRIVTVGVTAILFLFALLTFPRAIQADAQSDLDRLWDQYDAQMDAGEYGKAEQTALRMRSLAQRYLPEKTPYVLHQLASAIRPQGRYDEAEKLFRQSLEIKRRVLGTQHKSVAITLNNLADLYSDQGRYDQSEKLYRQALAIKRKIYPADHPSLATGFSNLASVLSDQGRYAEAEPLYRHALDIRLKKFGMEHVDVAMSLNSIGLLYKNQGRYADAEAYYKRSFAVLEKALRPNHPLLATGLDNLAVLYNDQNRYEEAERLHQKALAIRKEALGDRHPAVAITLSNLGCNYEDQGRYAEAEAHYQQAFDVLKEAFGNKHPDVATALNNLASLYLEQGRYEEAEQAWRQSLEIRIEVLGENHVDVAGSLNNLGQLHSEMGRYEEAESYHKRALNIREKALPAGHPRLAASLDNLGQVYEDQGRHAEAMSLMQRALAILKATFGAEHLSVATSLNNMAIAYRRAGDAKTAESLHKDCLAIREKLLSPDHPSVLSSLDNLAVGYADQGRYAEAEQVHKRVLAAREEKLGAEHPGVAFSLYNMAAVCSQQGRYEEAETLYKRALTIWRKRIGDDGLHVHVCLLQLANVYERARRQAEAKSLYDHLISIEAPRCRSPEFVWSCYMARATLLWKQNQRAPAVADMQRAVELSDVLRARVGGGEYYRAWSSYRYSAAFKFMTLWQAELGNLDRVYENMERRLSRSLIDQMDVAGIDLLAGLPEQESRRLREREDAVKLRIVSMERQLRALEQSSDSMSTDQEKKRAELRDQLDSALNQYRQVYVDIRSASPAYRLAVSQDRRPRTLEELKQWLLDEDALLLEFVIGGNGVFSLAISPNAEPRFQSLAVDEDQARALGIEAGPLTADELEKTLGNEEGTGVLQLLSESRDAVKAKQAARKLASLWEVLIPEAERIAILDGQYKRIVAVLDGSLAQLPFEALVTGEDENLEYLLDAGPPILYVPSGTVLLNLSERAAEDVPTATQPVLTIGDCDYGAPTPPENEDILAQLAPGSRYASLGGTLKPLKYAKREIRYVAKVFGDKEIPVAWLPGEMATERIVRHNLPGRRIVHFATHGLVDQSYGNLFGSLALTPGPKADKPSDDGFLTLAEIYELNLKGCELAILSACDTNAGPEQRGEGVWALSRGFLVAGARRVVASNWLVDDEAAASLISYFCGGIAQAGAKGEQPDYAKCLHEAKRWVRKQDKWKSPYYWAPFVLVGPN